jgi:hypothetical protein
MSLNNWTPLKSVSSIKTFLQSIVLFFFVSFLSIIDLPSFPSSIPITPTPTNLVNYQKVQS